MKKHLRIKHPARELEIDFGFGSKPKSNQLATLPAVDAQAIVGLRTRGLNHAEVVEYVYIFSPTVRDAAYKAALAAATFLKPRRVEVEKLGRRQCHHFTFRDGSRCNVRRQGVYYE